MEAQNRTSGVNLLSDDVLKQIFTIVHEDDPISSLSCLLVCKRWNQEVKGVIRRLNIEYKDTQSHSLEGAVRSLHQFSSLQELALTKFPFLTRGWFSILEELQRSCAGLRHLSIRQGGCRMDRKDLAILCLCVPHLRSLCLQDCYDDAGLPLSLHALSSLQEFLLLGAKNLNDLVPLGALTGLRSVKLHDCDEISDIECLSSLANSLAHLELIDCYKIRSLDPLTTLTSLESFNIKSHSQQAMVLDVSTLTRLRSLSCMYPEISVRGLGHVIHLYTLHLVSWSRLDEEDLTIISTLPQLESLRAPIASGVDNVSILSELRSLTSLALNLEEWDRDQPLLFSAPLLHLTRWRPAPGQRFLNPQNIRTLILYDARSSERIRLAQLEGLVNLQTFELRNCEQLNSFFPLPRNLVSLVVEGCVYMTAIDDLTSLVSIRSMEFKNCISLRVLSPLDGLTTLQVLRVKDCKKLESLPTLPVSLEELVLSSVLCTLPLGQVSSMLRLRRLLLSNCPQLQELPDLRSLQALQEVLIGKCEKLKELPPCPQGFAWQLDHTGKLMPKWCGHKKPGLIHRGYQKDWRATTTNALSLSPSNVFPEPAFPG